MSMSVVSAYLMCVLGGKAEPASKDIKKVLDSVGCKCDDADTEQLITALKGKQIDELIAGGMKKLSVLSSGGGGGGAAPGGAPAAAAAAPAAAKEEEEEEEEEADMGFSLFD
eukprot:GHVL01035363.1.p2 GENE.GHVL01035363.1~~GHVL01035363.1.p2  ORF type:complete len:112 (+),score=34.07 GHVL01035363.1:58-393(+)